jgi:hypothetical protein
LSFMSDLFYTELKPGKSGAGYDPASRDGESPLRCYPIVSRNPSKKSLWPAHGDPARTNAEFNVEFSKSESDSDRCPFAPESERVSQFHSDLIKNSRGLSKVGNMEDHIFPSLGSLDESREFSPFLK